MSATWFAKKKTPGLRKTLLAGCQTRVISFSGLCHLSNFAASACQLAGQRATSVLYFVVSASWSELTRIDPSSFQLSYLHPSCLSSQLASIAVDFELEALDPSGYLRSWPGTRAGCNNANPRASMCIKQLCTLHGEAFGAVGCSLMVLVWLRRGWLP